MFVSKQKLKNLFTPATAVHVFGAFGFIRRIGWWWRPSVIILGLPHMLFVSLKISNVAWVPAKLLGVIVLLKTMLFK